MKRRDWKRNQNWRKNRAWGEEWGKLEGKRGSGEEKDELKEKEDIKMKWKFDEKYRRVSG
jgi:hypothetical protein